MDIKTGQIIKNLLPDESVSVIEIKKLEDFYNITYLGITSNSVKKKVIDKETYESLEVVTTEGSFNFTGDARRFTLYAEAERINSAYQFDPLYAVNCSIVDPLPHQIEAVYKYLLPLPKIRFLLADDTGAGKTIMTGLLIKELIMRNLIERILIITPGGLTKQWQEDEMYLKFNITFKLVNRAAFQSDPTVFSNSNLVITSIDFIRNDDILNVLKETSWDMIIVDEAHKLSAFDYVNRRYLSKRYQALQEMSSKCEHLLLLTATPHRGRKDTFKNLLQLLDEDIFASDSLVTSRIRDFGETGVNKFFIRRLKEEMRDWDGNPLFKNRYTKTVLYELTPEEKKLYDKVTEYLSKKRSEAKEEKNIHVSLALMVMQRRLTSSIHAITKTIRNRYRALKGLLDELIQNPELLKQKHRLTLDVIDLEDYDEIDDQEKESLEIILSDPKKFKLFTTAKNLNEIKEETEQVGKLLEMAEALYNQNKEEQKFTKLRELLENHGVLSKSEKLVIFTEHKDTLEYLEKRLANSGYIIETIHGGKSVDERRNAQFNFARHAQILIATDAAGEGINLQFCRLLINWDIPWNPNRLEQRMGRIHRYRQEKDVLVFNLVAQNTREGNVLQRLLNKLDLIREQMGDDRVYDVISDIFENVGLEEIINSTFNEEVTGYDKAINEELTEENIKKKIKEQKEQLGYSDVDYKDARILKDKSDEKRLQPIYIRLFFEKAFKELGGDFTEIRKSIYRINNLPEPIAKTLKKDYNIIVDLRQLLFCFDKQVFLDYQNVQDLGKIFYINPGNPIFDSLINVVLKTFRDDMLKGTVLISPLDSKEYYAYFVKSQITDKRTHSQHESITDEQLKFIYKADEVGFGITSPAKFIDLYPPTEFVKKVTPPQPIDSEKVIEWAFANITVPQYEKTKLRVIEDTAKRKEYLEEAFTNIIADLSSDINDLQGKMLFGDPKVQEKIYKKQTRIDELKKKKIERLAELELMLQLDMKPPEVLGCAYIVPLTQAEFEKHYGMSRDDDVEAIAMKVAMDYEKEDGWNPEDVSDENAGYDIRSTNPVELKRYIEVKGRADEGGIMVSENEMNRLAQLRTNAWLYIVTHCKSEPVLHRIQDPAKELVFVEKSKGMQYFLPMEEWKKKANAQN